MRRPAVLHVTNAWPTDERPILGVFIREQILNIERQGQHCDVYNIRGYDGISAYIKAVSELRARAPQYDLIHCHHVFSALCAIAAGIKSEQLIVSFLNERGRNVLFGSVYLSRFLERYVQKRSCASIFKNASFREQMRSADMILPNSVDSSRFINIHKSEAENKLGLRPALRALFVSANSLQRPAKRHDRFLKVLEALKKRGILIEPIYLVSEKRARVPLFFSASDVLIVVSEHEGSPNAVKEALSSGLPVISLEVGDVKQQLQGVPDSYTLPVFDEDLMADLVSKALSSTTTREERRAAYLEKISSGTSAEQAIVDLYRRLYCLDAS